MTANVKTRKISWAWWEHEFTRLTVKSLSVLVHNWFSTVTELANTRGLVEMVLSPGSGQMCLLEGLPRDILALHLPSLKSTASAGQGNLVTCGFHPVIPAPSVLLAVSFGLIQPRAIYLDLNNNKKHIVKDVSVLTLKHKPHHNDCPAAINNHTQVTLTFRVCCKAFFPPLPLGLLRRSGLQEASWLCGSYYHHCYLWHMSLG